VVVGAATVLLLVLVAITLATGRMSRTVAGRRGAALRTVAGLGAVWVVAAVVGVPAPAGPPVAARSAAAVTAQQVGQIRDAVRDRRIFAAAVADDAFRDTPADQLLTGLRGKDVLLVFVESYGRVAVQDSTIAAADNAVLDDGTRRLAAAGFGARTGFLSSPTFGGISWLAHSTLQSGLWIDNQKRYNELVRTDRFTLSDAFSRAGWRTVGDIPSNHQDWPEGYSFYHYDTIYDARNVGYEGPTYSYADMPDQYTLSVFQRLELASPHQPVMAELDLVSSHTPWAPLPRMVDWSAVGDGSIFDGQPEQGQQPGEVWKDSEQVRQAYGESIRYTMNTLVSFVQTYPDPNLVMVVLGDHEPATIVSGEGASRDVPISVIAHDPSVLDRISTWGWTDGLRPAPDAPVWRMDAFRDKFLTAYGPGRP
ncbi:MAG TPA: sulfatase, partial [Rugosimonospora sp.]|nr:sulfatase [Rugosimonospora sp.]